MSFDIRKFLTENKLTKVSKSISENVDVFSDEEVVDLAFKAGEFVIDAKTALLDVAMGYEYGVPRKVVERVLNNFDMSVEELLGGEDSDQYDSLTDMPGFEGTRDALNNLGLKEYQHLDDLKQPNSAKGMEGRHSMEETLDDQPMDRDPTDGRGVNTSFDPSKYESVDQLMREIEVTANRAALQEKMKRVKEAYESLDQKATALEEGEDSKYMSSAKLKEMKKNAKTLRGMYEKYEKDYNKRFNEEMKPKKK